jgi:ferric-dicitrate binding protein FerR (iron transport regulator)
MAFVRHPDRRALPLALALVALVGCQGLNQALKNLPAPTVARLRANSPDVQVQRKGASVAYTPNMPLRKEDQVRTGNTTAAIDFNDGNTVMLNRNTSVEVGSIRLFFGEIFNAIFFNDTATTEIYTNELAAASESTKFLVRARGGNTEVVVVEGSVRCSPRGRPRWAVVKVRANQKLTATSKRTSGPVPTDAASEAGWVNDATRRLKRPPLVPAGPGQPTLIY